MRQSYSLLILLLLLGCARTTPAPAPTLTARSSTLPAPTQLPPQISTASPTPATSSTTLRPFAFGVEYALPGLAAIYGQTGARATRAAAETFGWGELEPSAPRAPGQHDYAWSKVDRYISEYQNAGFNQISIYTTAFNNWASSKPKHHFPDSKFMGDYEAYIANLVERYDADGKNDLPGLKYPVLDFVIEREWTEFFPGTTDEYLQLLAIAHRAVKQANPQARVWLVPLMMVDIFDRNPNAAEIERRAKINYTFRHPVGEIQKLLTHPELFDIVEIHSLADYSELDATAVWLRGEMKKNGYDKPIFIGDGMGISQMIWANSLRAFAPNATDADFLAFAPIRSNDPIRVIKLFDTMRDAKNAEHDSATRWFRSEHAKALPKKFAAAIYDGYIGMNVWALADIALLQEPRVTGSWFFMGMIEAQPGLNTWTPGSPRPAYYALKTTIEKLSDASSVDRLNVGGTVIAYRFIVRGNPVIVAWNEPGRIFFPGENEPKVSVNLPVAAASAKVMRVITDVGVSIPRIDAVQSSNGIIALTLDSTPVFIEPGK